MKRVELIYDADCPHAAQARQNLSHALLDAGLDSVWSEWERSAPGSPLYARLYGSPTILVDGRDIGGVEASDGLDSCRVYTDEKGELSGIPSAGSIVRALKEDRHVR